MMARKDNVVTRKVNDNIDHNTVVIILISLCMQIK